MRRFTVTCIRGQRGSRLSLMSLALLRTQMGLTQARLALRMGVVRQTVVRWEAGMSTPNGLQMIRLSEVLRVPLEDVADAFRSQQEKAL